ncbi:MAG: dTDP-4-dehydrorhamnose 3,5-epimerase [Thalassospira sp.]|uniref:dTDP-4-dehydrorhamnose 3,5-epimerase n=1 Tax=Thalassospira sp. TaxID=1912094 RepID=UPI003A86DA22
MQLEALEIPDVKLLVPKKFGDDRGFFSETYNQATLSALGIDHDFVQDNHSLSRDTGVVRGLHFQCEPHAQAKLVRVVRGRILDVALDIRKASPTFGRWVTAEISATEWNQIYIPKGFAHGFMTLEPDTEVIYKVSSTYAPDAERTIIWNDPDLGIDWPLSSDNATLSAKDADGMRFADYRANPAF